MIYESQEALDAALAYWQKRLRLQDWIVVAKIERMKVMGDRSGRCHWKINSKRAVIELLDPLDAIGWEHPQDHQRTLIHELLHLHFHHISNHSDFAEGSIGDVELEQAIECISTGLASLKQETS